MQLRISYEGGSVNSFTESTESEVDLLSHLVLWLLLHKDPVNSGEIWSQPASAGLHCSCW